MTLAAYPCPSHVDVKRTIDISEDLKGVSRPTPSLLALQGRASSPQNDNADLVRTQNGKQVFSSRLTNSRSQARHHFDVSLTPSTLSPRSPLNGAWSLLVFYKNPNLGDPQSALQEYFDYRRPVAHELFLVRSTSIRLRPVHRAGLGLPRARTQTVADAAGLK